MKRWPLACATLTFWAAPGAAQLSDTDPSSPAMAGEHAIPDQLFATPLAVADYLVGDFPESPEGRPLMQLSLKSSDPADETFGAQPGSAAFILTVETDGLLDDSISGERWLAVLLKEAEGWRVQQLHHQLKCARGPKPERGEDAPCP